MIVPFNKSQPKPEAPRQPPPDVFLAMAAAQMHTQGRLFEPIAETKDYADSPAEFEAGVRKHGMVRIDPEQPSMKEFLKKLPSDIEQHYEGGPVLRLKKDKQEVPTS